MNNKNIQVITHLDLDGVVSYLTLCWAYGYKLNVIGTTPKKLAQDYEKLLSSKKEWDKLYFLDLDVSQIGEQIDNAKTIIFDHHKTNLYPFTKAITKITDFTSCSKLLYETLIKARPDKDISQARKMLIALADDWDSNKKNTPTSGDLNIVYHSMSDKFNSFIEEYYEGFKPFDKFQTNTIALYKKHCEEYLNQLAPYFGIVNFEDQQNVTVCAIFCEKFVQESCDYILDKYNVDVVIAVLLNQQRIAVRRHPKNSTVDVSKFTQRIANGGGHAAAAGGTLTENFMEFTKMLSPGPI